MNLSHGDHTVSVIKKGRAVTAVFASHDIGAPHAILVRGWACASYSFRTIEFLGATTSAE